MNLNASCISCIVGREEKRIRPLKDEAMKKDYMIRVLHILAEDNGEPAPAKSIHLKKLQEEMLGAQPSWRETNRSYNLMMLKTEKDLQEKIAAAKDPLAAAMLYARAGNYIDFGAMQDVSKEKLEELLDRALSETLDSQTYEDFLQDLKKAKSLVYLTDNCGEIVADKLLISQLLHQFPELQITVVVRGEEAVNDATLIDAREVGLTELVPVIGNGTAIPGTYLPAVLPEVRDQIKTADLIISKGQGNFESLHECGLNIYYLFLCKCELFTRRFGMKQYEGVFIREKDVKIKG